MIDAFSSVEQRVQRVVVSERQVPSPERVIIPLWMSAVATQIVL
jgi:hypothetical protein